MWDDQHRNTELSSSMTREERFLNLSIFKLVSFSSDDPASAKHSRIREIFLAGQFSSVDITRYLFQLLSRRVLVNKATVDSGTSYVQLSGQLHHVLDLLLLVGHSAPSLNL